jgi:hypothetical protein
MAYGDDIFQRQMEARRLYGTGMGDLAPYINKSADILAQGYAEAQKQPLATAQLEAELYGKQYAMNAAKEQALVEQARWEAGQKFKEKELAQQMALAKVKASQEDELGRALKEQRLSSMKDEADRRSEELTVPGYGQALTREDAKNLKGAVEEKSKFDSQINELIKLRDVKGTEFVDREAVSRGRQLSKDLLLTYKNLAKLGVLSQADEAIINAIIPPDPLAMDYVPFQDPILSNLSKFKEDSDKDFQTRLSMRLRGGQGTVVGQGKSQQQQAPQRSVIKVGNGFRIEQDAAGKLYKVQDKSSVAGK